jgi:hypothetical protein
MVDLLLFFIMQGYKEKIVDIREEILRKRRAGKLPGDTTSVLKAWWQSHSKWPYPTVSLMNKNSVSFFYLISFYIL